jgi:23S rRNA (pseudouridine1915-N3)-methyltransferase
MIYCVFVGDFKDKRLLQVSGEFFQRLKRLWPITIVEISKKEKDVLRFIQSKKGKGVLVSLDARGESMDSLSFCKWVTQSPLDIYFFAWDTDGPPKGLSGALSKSLSLSPMIYSHELARVLLMEQLYRAGAVLRGHPYPH